MLPAESRELEPHAERRLAGASMTRRYTRRAVIASQRRQRDAGRR